MSWLDYRQELRGRLTPEHALFIERVRTDPSGETWRGVAYIFDERFPGVLGEGMSGNQGAGMFLCELAGEMLGRQVD